MKRLRRLLPFAISLVLVIVLISYAPWAEVGDILSDLDAETIIGLVGLSILYYAIKAIRFWCILKAMGIYRPLLLVAISYISAQPVSLLPAGELYRSEALRRHAGVPVQQSLPQFILQGLLEGSALGSLMLVSALALGTLRIPALILTLAVIASFLVIKRGYIADFGRLLNKLPWINTANSTIENFSQQHRDVLGRRWLPLLYGLSLLGELAGVAIAYVSVSAIGGHISLYEAALFYTIPIIVGFVSFLPGGLGASEQSAVGVLLIADVAVGQAVAATLIMRVTIVGLGVVFGVGGLLAIRLEGRKLLPDKSP